MDRKGSTTVSDSYDPNSVIVLEGAEAVRKRPAMYIGGTGRDGLHHLVWEIVDNAIDEVMNGFASTVQVNLGRDGRTITVVDNGRGIPVGINKKAKKSALELVLTKLHSSGKFDNNSYKTAGGLHGVGASVVNALSSSLIARVKRAGKEHRLDFRRGIPRGEVKVIGEARGTGTSIQFTPDDQIFGEVSFDAEMIRERLEVKAYLNPGARIVFRDETTGRSVEMKHEGGISDYLAVLNKQRGARTITPEIFRFEHEIPDTGARLDIAISWTDAPREGFSSFVNTIPTHDGGTHEQGLKDAIVRGLRAFIEAHSLEPRGVKLSADDLREGVNAVASLFIAEPQFQGQTKDKLNNPEARSMVDGAVRPALEQWLHDHKPWGEALVARATQAARARLASRAAATKVRRKSAISHRLNLPGKLADCTSTDPSISELFIVEGDSAGGSAKQARDRDTQAILPLRGKVLNAEHSSQAAVMKNQELNNIVQALGCGMGKDFDVKRLRYDKIILLMDADVDGHHIATLLLTFFYRYLPGLIAEDHVFLAQPPLYRIKAGNKDYWAADDREKDKILSKLPARFKPEISRFKGLGEMMPKTLFTTTLDPKRRRLLRVTIPEDAVMLTENTIHELMGKDPQARYQHIMHGAHELDDLDV